jgi:hypothetical protein
VAKKVANTTTGNNATPAIYENTDHAMFTGLTGLIGVMGTVAARDARMPKIKRRRRTTRPRQHTGRRRAGTPQGPVPQRGRRGPIATERNKAFAYLYSEEGRQALENLTGEALAEQCKVSKSTAHRALRLVRAKSPN